MLENIENGPFSTGMNADTIFAPEPQLRDELWLLEGGRVTDWLRLRKPGPVRIDFSRLIWADPVPLLAISALCCEYKARGGEVLIDLGSTMRKDNRFLLFISQHGFLAALARGAEFGWRGTRYGEPELLDLESNLRSLPGALAYQNSECIPASAFSTADLTRSGIDALVEGLLASARPRVVSWLSGSARRLNLLMYQLRLFLVEALDNVAEHAYPEQDGFCAVYARIRSGAPDERLAFQAWKQTRTEEGRHCPALQRSETGKRPGWLELFVCDVGVGLDHNLETRTAAPLKELTARLFKEPVSRHADRLRSGKTSMTGLQRMGELLVAGAKLHGRGDFVRIYSAGEWVGDHLPWPEKGLEAGQRNVRNDPLAQPPPGVALHYSIEPAPAEAQAQLSFYPPHFFPPTADDLRNVREALAQSPAPAAEAAYDFVDLFIFDDEPSERTLEARAWSHRLSSRTLILRPSVRQRKGDLISQLQAIIQQNPQLDTIVFADVPWAAAIDFSNIIGLQARLLSAPKHPIRLYILSQDWICAGFRSTLSPMAFTADHELARSFFGGTTDEPSAAMVARALKQRDSQLFWARLRSAYINEPVLWSPATPASPEEEIWGYLDIPLGLSDRESYAAARRSLRRAVSSFAEETVYVGDELVQPLLAGEFEVQDAEAALGTAHAPGVLVGSVRATGSTVERLLRRASSKLRGRVQLLQHPDLMPAVPGDDNVIALDWLPPRPASRGTRTLFSRIPNTPFVIRGGEASIPLPRFLPPDGERVGQSLYGEDPATAYRQWERLGILRIGHWVYGLNHDLLTLRLGEAVDLDAVSGGEIAIWLADQLREWTSELGRDQGCLVVYPQHGVTDRLVRHIKARIQHERLSFFPTATIPAWSQSPIVISPMAREAIANEIERHFQGGGRVVFLDDAIISGRTLSQVTQAVEGLWEVLKGRDRVRNDARLIASSLAIVDRSSAPAQRSLVLKGLDRHRRLWRWDVPTLGHASACPLCALRGRWREMAGVVQNETLRLRLDQWLELWAPHAVETGRFDIGVMPRPLAVPSSTRFGIERAGKAETAHVVEHMFSTSRVAISVEIARSTTRKDYPLRKATEGGAAADYDVETGIETLAAQLLLLYDSLSATDRLDRLYALIDLLWRFADGTTTSALAGMLLQLDPSLAGELWARCEEVIEKCGFPHDDTLIAAIALHHVAGAPRVERKNADWELFELCRLAADRYREPVGMIFRVFGWSPNSAHNTLLPNLLRKKNHTRKTLRQTTLMLEQLANALAGVIPIIVEETDLQPVIDAGAIRSLALTLRAQTSEEINFAEPLVSDIRRTLNEAFQRLFAVDGYSSQYTGALTLQIAPSSPTSAILGNSRRALQESWPDLMIEKGPEVARKWTRPVEVRFGVSILLSKTLFVYFDASVRKTILEILTNVAHRSHPIPSPWPETSHLPEADMWVRIVSEQDGSAVVFEFVNGSMAPAVTRPQTSSALFHAQALGGFLETDYDGPLKIMTSRLKVPTLAGLSRHA